MFLNFFFFVFIRYLISEKIKDLNDESKIKNSNELIYYYAGRLNDPKWILVTPKYAFHTVSSHIQFLQVFSVSIQSILLQIIRITRYKLYLWNVITLPCKQKKLLISFVVFWTSFLKSCHLADVAMLQGCKKSVKLK